MSGTMTQFRLPTDRVSELELFPGTSALRTLPNGGLGMTPFDPSQTKFGTSAAPDKTAVAVKKPKLVQIKADKTKKDSKTSKPEANGSNAAKSSDDQKSATVVENMPDDEVGESEPTDVSAMLNDVLDNVQSSMFMHTAPQVRDDSPDEDTWFSKLIAPEKDELEAAQNGMRWHWAMENRFMPPGSKWNDTVFKGVDRENQWLSRMLAQKNGNQPSGAEVRAKQMELNRIRSQYDALLREFNAGQWDTSSREYKEFKEAAEKLRANYVAQGGNPDDLRPPALQVGKLTQAGSNNLVKKRETLGQTLFIGNKIATALTDGTVDDPQKLKLLTTALDKDLQSVAAKLGGDSSSMADAEKIRIQIQFLPENARAEVYKTVENYRRAMTSIAREAMARGWSTNLVGKIAGAASAFESNEKSGVTDLTAFGKLAGAAHDALLGGKLTELPQDLAVAMQTVQQMYDEYMNNMMLAANMALDVSAYMAQWLYDRTYQVYNNEAFTLGRMSELIPQNMFPKIDYELAAKAVPTDKLIMAIDFPNVVPVQHKGNQNKNDDKNKKRPPGTSETTDGVGTTTTTLEDLY